MELSREVSKAKDKSKAKRVRGIKSISFSGFLYSFATNTAFGVLVHPNDSVFLTKFYRLGLYQPDI